MALTTKSDGLGAANKFTHTWVDDYHDVLTGVMNDQPITLNYRPGSGTTPTLTLKGDGSGALLKGYKTDNTTQAFAFGSGGDLTLISSIKVNPPSVPGSTTSYVLAQVGADPTGRSSLGIRSDGSGNLRLGSSGTAYAVEMYTDGSRLVCTTGATFGGSLVGNLLAVSGNATANGGHTLINFRAKGSGANAGINIWICPSGTDPTTGDGLTDGDIVFSY